MHTRALAVLAGLLLFCVPALNAQSFALAKLRGDVDGDGRVTEVDAQLLRAHLVGRPLPKGASITPAGDANGDGRVSAVEAAVISRFGAGHDVGRFPVGRPEPGSDPAGPTGPSTAGELFFAQLCEVDVTAGTFSCTSPAPETGGVRPDLILGGGSVQLVSGGPATLHRVESFNEDTTRVPARVRNLIVQPIGTTDGSTPAPNGIRVFFNNGPTVTAVSSGTIASASVRMAGTGTADFMPPSGSPVYANKPFYQYDDVVAQNATTSARTWQFVYSPNVTRFSYSVFISAPVQYELGWIDVSPPLSTIGEAATTMLAAEVRNALGTVVGDAVSWSSEDGEIATVNPTTGEVTGIAPGTATITATSLGRSGSAPVTVTAAPEAAPDLLEDFRTYSSSSEMRSDPRGIYHDAEDIPMGLAQAVLDESLGYGTSDRSMRYDFVAGLGTISRMLVVPNVTEIWVEWTHRFEPGYSIEWGGGGDASYKFLHVEVTADDPPGGRFGHNFGNGDNGYSGIEPPNDVYDAGFAFTNYSLASVADGQWHTYRYHVKLGSPDLHELWVDGVLKARKTDFDTRASSIWGVALGRNHNQNPTAPQSQWWGRVQLWWGSNDPGW